MFKLRRNPKKSPIKQISRIKIKRSEPKEIYNLNKPNNTSFEEIFKTIPKIKINPKKSPIKKISRIKVKKQEDKKQKNIFFEKIKKPSFIKELKHKKIIKEIDKESINCPFCQNEISITENIIEDENIDCPNCNHTFLLDSNIESISEKEKKYLIKPSKKVKILSLLLIVFGFIFLINPSPFNVKLSVTFILIGISLFTILTDKKFEIVTNDLKNQNINEKIKSLIDKPLDIYDKIAIITVILVLFLYIITGDVDIEIFIILFYLGFLILKEFTKEFTPKNLKIRLNILLIAFIAIFILIITKRIISILSI